MQTSPTPGMCTPAIKSNIIKCVSQSTIYFMKFKSICGQVMKSFLSSTLFTPLLFYEPL